MMGGEAPVDLKAITDTGVNVKGWEDTATIEREAFAIARTTGLDRHEIAEIGHKIIRLAVDARDAARAADAEKHDREMAEHLNHVCSAYQAQLADRDAQIAALQQARKGHVDHIRLFLGPEYGVPTPEHEDSFLTYAINGQNSSMESFKAAYSDRESQLSALQQRIRDEATKARSESRRRGFSQVEMCCASVLESLL